MKPENALSCRTPLLFNGGVFNSERIGQHSLMCWGWTPKPLIRLNNSRPDLSVAYGAAIYGLAKKGDFFNHRGGSPQLLSDYRK